MTDTTVFVRNLVTQVTQFVDVVENLKLVADQLGTDSYLSGQAAAAAQANRRTDLTAAEFDNFKSAMDVLSALLDSTNVAVNTGGKVKLAFYKIM